MSSEALVLSPSFKTPCSCEATVPNPVVLEHTYLLFTAIYSVSLGYITSVFFKEPGHRQPLGNAASLNLEQEGSASPFLDY